MVKRINGFKKIVRLVHLYLGLASGLIVLIVGLTGSLYIFEEECRDLFQHRYYYVAAGGEKKPLQELQDSLAAKYPDLTVTGIRFKEAQDAAVIFSTRDKKAISVNPYTGAVIGIRDMERDFFTIVLRIHRSLLLGDAGKAIIKWNVLIFFLMCASGLILWWPKQARFFKQAVRINFKTKNRKRFNRDLHTVLGYYALPVLMLISFTGMFMVYDSVKDGIKFITGAPAKKKEDPIRSIPVKGKSFTIAEAYQYMIQRNPAAKETFINVPSGNDAAIRIVMRYPYAIVRKQVSMFFDRYTGKVLKEEDFKNATAYEKVARSDYSLHTGDIPALGIGSKIIYFFAGLIAASLPVTGFLIWLGRQKKRRKPILKRNITGEDRPIVT